MAKRKKVKKMSQSQQDHSDDANSTKAVALSPRDE